MAIRGAVLINIETCKGCELCIDACPQDSLMLSSKINKIGYHYSIQYQDNCTGCTNCAIVCPDSVITVLREPKEKKSSPEVQANSHYLRIK